MKTYNDINSYIAVYPKDVQAILQKLRATIKKAAPKATEAIKYGIPTFVLNGNLVHFGGFTKHVGFYPGCSGIRKLKKEGSKYDVSKGRVQFPFDTAIPLGLIGRIVKYRIAENAHKAKKGSA